MLSSSSRISSVGRSTVPYVSHGRLPGFIVPSHSAALNKGVYEITGIVSQTILHFNIYQKCFRSNAMKALEADLKSVF